MPLVDNAWYVNGSTGVTVFDLGSSSNSAGATLTLTNITVPAGALIVVIASEVTSASAGTMADGTNTYSTATSGAMSTAAGFGTIFFSANVSALSAATLTYTKQTTGRASSISAFYATGIATSTPQDATVTATSAVNSASPTVTSGTPAQSGELIIGACAYSNAAAKTLTNTGSFVTPFANNSGQSTASCGGGHLNVNGSGTVTFNPTLSGASDNRTMIVGFKLANTTLVGWWNVTKWAASTSKVCGNLVRQNATPNLNAERVFVCIASTGGTGQTAATEPAWTTTAQCTRGAKFTDNTVTWQEATGIAALNGDLTNTPNWTTVKNTAIVLGQVIKNNAGTLILICTTAGTAGNGAEPSWAAFTNAGATTADNTATWTTLGASFSALSAPHARLANAYTSTWGQAGNAFFLCDNHSETQPSILTLTSPGTQASPVFAYSFDHTGSVPPNAVTSGAQIMNTFAANSSFLVNGIAYYAGITFFVNANGQMTFGNSNAIHSQSFDGCTIKTASTLDYGLTFAVNGQNHDSTFILNNTPLNFSNTSCGCTIQAGNVIWKNTASALPNVVPTILFGNHFAQGYYALMVSGVDLSAAGSGKTLVGAQGQACEALFTDCQLGASVTVAATPTAYGTNVDVINCDSSATNYRHERYGYAGTQTVETVIVRTGGATDGTTPISWKLVSTANSRWVFPFVSLPIAIWNTSTSAVTTLTIYGTTTGGGVPNNDDIWAEVEYLGSGSSPLGSFITTTKASNLAASSSTNNSSDGSTWGGSGAGNGFKIVVPSFTPAQAGPFYIVIKVGKASSTYYIDPAIQGVS